MPVYPITNANPATDELEIVGHSLVSGDTFATVYSPDGGTPPAPLVAGDDYWIIRTDADHVRLATSSANAMAGIHIDLTDAGSFTTLQLLRGLPYRRPRIAAPGVQVFSVDQNSAWESMVSLWSMLAGLPHGGEWVINTLSVAGTLGVVGATTLNGTLDVAGLSTLGAVDLTAQVRLASTISPTITSTFEVVDFAPASLGTANQIRATITTAGSGATLGSLTGAVDGRVIALHVIGTVAGDDLTLVHESGSGTAAFRFLLANAADLVIPRGGSVTLCYDGTSARWRVIGKNF